MIFRAPALVCVVIALVLFVCHGVAFGACDTPGPFPVVTVINPADGAVRTEGELLLRINGVDTPPNRVEVEIEGKIVHTATTFDVPASAGPHERELRRRLVVDDPAAGEIQVEPKVGLDVLIVAWDERNRCSVRSLTWSATRGEIHALVIGISTYKSVGSLNWAKDDADMFLGWITKTLPIDNRNIINLRNDGATVKAIGKALDTIRTKTKRDGGEGDTVFVFFSGHGFFSRQPEYPKQAYLVPYDAEVGFESTFVAHEELFKKLEDLTPKRKVLVFDACFSGAGAEGKTVSSVGVKGDIVQPVWSKLNGVYGMFSSAENQPSYEKAELGHGVFTYFLVEGFDKAEDSDHDGVISLKEVFDYARKNVSEYTKDSQVPQDRVSGSIQSMGVGKRR